MHNNFETLQKKCKKYHLKNSLKLILPTLLTTVALIGLYFFINSDTSLQTEAVKTQNTTQQLKIPKKKIAAIPKETSSIMPKSKPIETQKTRKDLQYSLELDYDYSPQPAKQKEQVKQKVVKTQKKVAKAPEEIKTDNTQKSSFKMSLKKVDSLKKMLSIYEKKENYDSALKIAAKYYENKNYTQALLWSKKANILNKKDAGSWIIYAKSEYAKGNKKRAIEIISLYLGNSKSPEASTLLLSWTKGE